MLPLAPGARRWGSGRGHPHPPARGLPRVDWWGRHPPSRNGGRFLMWRRHEAGKRPERGGAPAVRAPVRPPAGCNGQAGGGATHESPRLTGGARWVVASTPGTTGSSTRCHAAPVLEHLVGSAGDPAGSASAPALPPVYAPSLRRSSPILHITTPRVTEVRATRSAMPLLTNSCCGSRVAAGISWVSGAQQWHPRPS